MFTSMRAARRSLGPLVHPGGRKMEIGVRPHGRHAALKNQHQLEELRRCGAKTRFGTPCRRPAMRNGRCRLHGGLSTGPKTSEGRHRIRLALLKHGRYTKQAKQERLQWRELVRTSMGLLRQLKGLPPSASGSHESEPAAFDRKGSADAMLSHESRRPDSVRDLRQG
jgi:hypothetical protein